MPVEVTWLDDAHTIVCTRYIGSFSAYELGLALDEAKALHASVPYTVVSIGDMRQAPHTASISSFAVARKGLADRPANSHPTILLVGSNAIVEALGNAFQRLYGGNLGYRIEFVKTIDDARTRANALLHEG